MNTFQLKSLFEDNPKPLATKKIKQGGSGNVIVIRLLAGAELPAHQTPVPASLILLEGAATYSQGEIQVEMQGDCCVEIPANELHHLKAAENGALLILVQ